MPPLPTELRAEILSYLDDPKDFQSMARVDRAWRTNALAVPVVGRHVRQNGACDPLPDSAEALARVALNIHGAQRNLAAGRAQARRLTAAEVDVVSRQTTAPRGRVPGVFWDSKKHSPNGEWAITSALRNDQPYMVRRAYQIGRHVARDGRFAFTRVQDFSAWDLRRIPPVEHPIMTLPVTGSTTDVVIMTFLNPSDVAIANGGHIALVHTAEGDRVVRSCGGNYAVENIWENNLRRHTDHEARTVCIAASGRWGMIDYGTRSGPDGAQMYVLDLRGPRTKMIPLHDLPPEFGGVKRRLDFRDCDTRVVALLSDGSYGALNFRVREDGDAALLAPGLAPAA